MSKPSQCKAAPSLTPTNCEYEPDPDFLEWFKKLMEKNVGTTTSDEVKEDKKFYCSRCSKVFLIKRKFINHRRVCKHVPTCAFVQNDPPIRIPKSKNLESRKLLLTESSPITPDQLLVCKICSKSFQKKNNFNKHLKIHEDDPQECDKCGKIFKNKTSLSKHRSAYHRKQSIIKDLEPMNGNLSSFSIFNLSAK